MIHKFVPLINSTALAVSVIGPGLSESSPRTNGYVCFYCWYLRRHDTIFVPLKRCPCLRNCPEIYSRPSLLFAALARPCGRPALFVSLLREAGNNTVKSPLMRLGIRETFFFFFYVAVRTRSAAGSAFSWFNLSFLNSPHSRWLLIGVGRRLFPPIKTGRVALRGGSFGWEVWEHFPTADREWV